MHLLLSAWHAGSEFFAGLVECFDFVIVDMVTGRASLILLLLEVLFRHRERKRTGEPAELGLPGTG